MQLQFKFTENKSPDQPVERDTNSNKVHPGDGAFHNWYRFVLSFPPHLVRHYIQKFNINKNDVILDPFCGTGTTLVESKLIGIPSIGVEAIPFAHFASSVKVDWEVNTEEFQDVTRRVADETLEKLRDEGFDDSLPFQGDIKSLNFNDMDTNAQKLLINNSISPVPLHKTITLLNTLKKYEERHYYNHALLALANALVFKISNLKFGPEVGVAKPKFDYPVINTWLNEIRKITKDIDLVKGKKFPSIQTKIGDSREISKIIAPESIDAVITSPPYPNEKDYTRTTRLESVILGFINNMAELRSFKRSLIRSNTRGVYKNDNDDLWISNHENILKLADAIEKKRIELGKTSGFEKLYSKVTLQYFGGMARHLADLRGVLRKGALLAYVVGDQASYFKVMIQTGKLLAEIAQSQGYELIDIELFRKRFATATSSELREEVILLRWPG